MVWPVASMHQLCLSFPSLNPGWVGLPSLPSFAHPCEHLAGGVSCYFVFTGDLHQLGMVFYLSRRFPASLPRGEGRAVPGKG